MSRFVRWASESAKVRNGFLLGLLVSQSLLIAASVLLIFSK